jgi:hypothetical protein
MSQRQWVLLVIMIDAAAIQARRGEGLTVAVTLLWGVCGHKQLGTCLLMITPPGEMLISP